MLGKLPILLFIGCGLLSACAEMPSPEPAAANRQPSDCKTQGNLPNDRDRANPDQLKLISEAKEHFRRSEYGLAEQKFRLVTEKSSFGQNVGSRVVTLEAWYGLAASYDQLRRFDLSDPIYEHIKAEYGVSVTYYNNYGYSLQMRGETSKARVQFREAMTLSPQCQIPRNNLNAVIRN